MHILENPFYAAGSPVKQVVPEGYATVANIQGFPKIPRILALGDFLVYVSYVLCIEQG